jgi:hypothetical protein
MHAVKRQIHRGELDLKAPHSREGSAHTLLEIHKESDYGAARLVCRLLYLQFHLSRYENAPIDFLCRRRRGLTAGSQSLFYLNTNLRLFSLLLATGRYHFSVRTAQETRT